MMKERETPESATANLAMLIGIACGSMVDEQLECAVESLAVLARKAGVGEGVLARALHPFAPPPLEAPR